MASDLKVQRIIPPWLGLDTDSAPELTAPERGQEHTNLLLDRPGAAVLRGPLVKVTNNAGNVRAAADRPLLGYYGTADSLLFTQGDGNASARVAPWESLWKYAASDAELVQQGGVRSIQLQSPFGDTITAALGTANDGGWGSGTTWLLSRVYAPSIAASSATVIEEGHRRFNTGIVFWDPISLPAGQAAWAINDRPQYVVGVRSHYSRLFACAARDGTGFSTFTNYSTDYNPHQIYWTNPMNGAVGHVATDWRNPVSLKINKAVVGAQSAGDGCIGLAQQDRNLVIFKRNSVHVLYGYGEATWNIRQVADNLGCIDPRSIVEMGTDVYFMSQQGFMRYDGTRFRNVSGLLRSSLVKAAVQRCGPNGTDGGFVTASAHRDGYILVSVGIQNYDTGLGTVDFCGYYYPSNDSWSRFASAAIDTFDDWQDASGVVGALLGTVETSNFSIGFTNFRYYNARHLYYPEASPASTYGKDQSGANAANTSSTLGEYASRLYNLASPLLTSKLQAALLDYDTEKAAGTASGLSFIVRNALGQTLLASTAVPASASGSGYARQRFQVDTFSESGNQAEAELYVAISSSDGNAFNSAKVFAADLLYQPSQERRSSP